MTPAPAGRLTYGLRDGSIRAGGRRLRLQAAEYTILTTLFSARPRWTSTETLLDIVYPNPDTQPLTALRVIHLYVFRLRCKLLRTDWWIEHAPCHRLGYRVVPVQLPVIESAPRRRVA